MRVSCRTNLDLANEEWPDDLPTVPNVGDRIRSKTVWGGSFQLELQVVSITWVHVDEDYCFGWHPVIELHMTEFQRKMPPKNDKGGRVYAGSITSFYQWYAPLVGRSISAFI